MSGYTIPITEKETTRDRLRQAISAGIDNAAGMPDEHVLALIDFANTAKRFSVGAFECDDGTLCPLSATNISYGNESNSPDYVNGFYEAFDDYFKEESVQIGAGDLVFNVVD